MPWQGNEDIMIDRFDARAHLDFIREPKEEDEDEVLSNEERQLNYERYRILVQNEFLTSIIFIKNIYFNTMCYVIENDFEFFSI